MTYSICWDSELQIFIFIMYPSAVIQDWQFHMNLD